MISKIDSLPPISEMMRESGLEPKKSFGQNFLFDLNLTNKIARSVPDIENATVIEVGPGPGGLTRSLLIMGAKKVIAIEKDRETQPILEKIQSVSDGKLEIIFDDALRVFSENKLSGLTASICSNLPYNVGTELLIQWLHYVSNPNSPIKISSMTLMFQREVAERIVASVGDEQYGRLSVLVSLVSDAKILFNVPNTAFVPKPKVQSAIVQIIPNQKKISAIKELSKIEAITAKLFGQRRKMIRGIIKDFDWAQFGLLGTERAEELSPQKFAEIALLI
ncbi:MAG: 16S rRNA (adenine(1518)-N(6)/adenine(1519)-N(6))-dimethyltransferase RsmA [Alphaproteobacteria bacterium]|jgi:16S rRNA (adenine1518-N6/adenine1519-N6)-dimethyltransferase|nr:16S rRNA (adenine(1518)-N(6)/adenine(1519)-N(6))-dimethyltransferase RsmA [Alphaproteobacteria bacterium]